MASSERRQTAAVQRRQGRQPGDQRRHHHENRLRAPTAGCRGTDLTGSDHVDDVDARSHRDALARLELVVQSGQRAARPQIDEGEAELWFIGKAVPDECGDRIDLVVVGFVQPHAAVEPGAVDNTGPRTGNTAVPVTIMSVAPSPEPTSTRSPIERSRPFIVALPSTTSPDWLGGRPAVNVGTNVGSPGPNRAAGAKSPAIVT